MDFEQLQRIWTDPSSLHGAPGGDDVSGLDAAIRNARRLQQKAKRRDYVELVTAVAMASGFVWIATLAPVVWPWWAAAALTLAVGLVFVRERTRVDPAPAAAIDVRHGLTVAVEQVDHQIRLLGSVALWYLMPLGVVVGLVLVGTVLGVRAELPPEVWARGRAGLIGAFVGVVPIVAGVFWVVWWLNRRAVTGHLLPHRDQLIQALRQLDADENDANEGEM